MISSTFYLFELKFLMSNLRSNSKSLNQASKYNSLNKVLDYGLKTRLLIPTLALVDNVSFILYAIYLMLASNNYDYSSN